MRRRNSFRRQKSLKGLPDLDQDREFANIASARRTQSEIENEIQKENENGNENENERETVKESDEKALHPWEWREAHRLPPLAKRARLPLQWTLPRFCARQKREVRAGMQQWRGQLSLGRV